MLVVTLSEHLKANTGNGITSIRICVIKRIVRMDLIKKFAYHFRTVCLCVCVYVCVLPMCTLWLMCSKTL